MAEDTRQHTATDQPGAASDGGKSPPDHVNLVSHATLFYWWPVWAVGYIMAFVTFFFGETVSIGQAPAERIHYSNSLGLIFTMVLFAVLIVTNMTLRGMTAVAAVLGVLLVTVVFSLFGWWDAILYLIPDLTVHMNFGFYVLISTLVFLPWALAFFVFDRLTYWRIEAGQITRERLVGGGEESYDTSGIVFEEFHDDPFRHWMLGFGSGDLKISVRGAKNTEFLLPNVLFANHKVTQAQDLIKRKPD